MSLIHVYHAAGDELEELHVEAATLDEATMRTGHGVYTVLRTYPGLTTVRLVQHFKRLHESARMLGEPLHLSDQWLRQMLRRSIERSGYDLVRVRMTLPFGRPGELILAVESFTPPGPELYANGVRVGLVEGQRESPLAKNSQFIEWRKSLLATQPPGTYEIILHDHEGLISEGISSNFYAVIDGSLRTAGEAMLEGVARSILLDVAPEVLPVDLRRIRADELAVASEALLTSTSRGPVPIIQVGDTTIGDGRPGRVAADLKSRYDTRIEQELEPI